MNMSANIDALTGAARAMFRTVGPRVSGATYSDDDVALRRCTRCTPEPTIHECPVCNWQTEKLWSFRLHLKLNPNWCRGLGGRRARNWAHGA